MTNPLEKVVAQKKEAIEAVMEMFERGAEVLASAVGEIFPLCEVAAPILRLTLDNVQSNEVFYVKEQFLSVRNKLDILSTQLEEIDYEIKKGQVDAQYFSVEENIHNQFRKYMDIFEAKPQFRETKTRLFLEHFSKTGGEKNLNSLCDAVLGRNIFVESVLEVVKNYEGHNRRILENFCVRMKELFCLGLIALLGHTALTQEEEEEQQIIEKWNQKMQEVEIRMKTAIEECVAAFPEQACLDIQRLVREKGEKSDPDTAQELVEFLSKKYDWVCWSVRVVSHSGSSYRNWRAGDNFQHVVGQSWFDVPNINNVTVVVSYSSRPQPVLQDCIQQLMDGMGKKGDVQLVAEDLERKFPGMVVHTVSRHKEISAYWSFPEDCHYWKKHKNMALCVHSE
ncbi:protein rapunzel-like [Brienomyrus brachyistius]|uniref:protein rapunzel-like n=1 Tax=Brienomyrus brachyistius TaxID=42636 RepID=UPI0020B32ACC|nr:protein rapunzel-like [Brienomyrus brachyistius]